MKHMFEYGMMEKEKKTFPKRADIWFLLGILAVALVLLLLFRINLTRGSFAEVSYDGVVLMKIPLSQAETTYYLIIGQDTDTWQGRMTEDGMKEVAADTVSPFISIQEFSEAAWRETSQTDFALTEDFYNIILYRNGEVQMIDSSCPDLICVHHRAVCSVGESIICLPHKIVIEVVGEGERDLDGVVY